MLGHTAQEPSASNQSLARRRCDLRPAESDVVKQLLYMRVYLFITSLV